jgi:hypothetical protein
MNKAIQSKATHFQINKKHKLSFLKNEIAHFDFIQSAALYSYLHNSLEDKV